jgi:hypothetical protein
VEPVSRTDVFLDRSGAIPSGDSRPSLHNLAADLRVDEIVGFLNPAGAPACVPTRPLIASSRAP